MKYKLRDIEIWEYDGIGYPRLFRDIYLTKKYVGKSYEYKNLRKVEEYVKNYYFKKGYPFIAIMNPLYPDTKSTVLSVDLTKNKLLKTDKRKRRKTLSNFEYALIRLFKKREQRFNQIFSSGQGSLKIKRINGVVYSEDKELHAIELMITKIANDNKNTIMASLKEYESIKLLQSLQWMKRSPRINSLFFFKLEKGSIDEKNLVLFIFIQEHLKRNFPKKKLFAALVKTILKNPSSAVRNKALSILSEDEKFPDMIKNNQEFIDFVKIVSKTRQKNCSYPAKEILKTLDLLLKSRVGN